MARAGHAAAYVDPASDPSVVEWWRADQGLYHDTAKTTPAEATDDPAAAWEGIVNGHTLEQGTAGSRPLLKKALAAISGHDALFFDGTDDWLGHDTLASLLLAGLDQPMTLIAVAAHSSETASQTLTAMDDSAADAALFQHYYNSSTDRWQAVYRDDASNTTPQGGSVAADTAWHYHSFVRRLDPADGYDYTIDGAANSSEDDDLGQITLDLFTVGARRFLGGSPSQFLHGHLAELIVCDEATSFREDHEAYIAERYGL